MPEVSTVKDKTYVFYLLLFYIWLNKKNSDHTVC